jgi:hypothetical protein
MTVCVVGRVPVNRLPGVRVVVDHESSGLTVVVETGSWACR